MVRYRTGTGGKDSTSTVLVLGSREICLGLGFRV